MHRSNGRMQAESGKSSIWSGSGKIRRLLIRYAVTATCISVSPFCHATRYWSNAQGDWDIANPKNWTKWSVAKEIQYNGTESVTDAYDPQLGFDTAGHYRLSGDLTLVRCIADTTTNNKDIFFDFDSDAVLTLRGKSDGVAAFGVNGGKNARFSLTGGTILVPELFCGDKYASCISYPRGDKNSERTTNVTFSVYNRTGATASLMTPLLRLNWGTGNLFVVSNSATAVVGTLQLGEGSSAVSNGVIVSSGGHLSITNSVGTLKLGGGSNVRGMQFTVEDGGALSDVQRFLFAGSSDHMMAFRGGRTDVTLTSTNTCSKFNSSRCRLEVTSGARLTLNGSQGRIWAGENQNHTSNTIYVAGAGSQLICNGTGTFLGAGNKSCGNILHIADGAYVKIKRFHLGQQSLSHGNLCIVESGGVLTDTDPKGTQRANGMVVGFGESNTSVMSNMLIVTAGGTVSNEVIAIGASENSCGNALEIDGGTMHTSGSAYAARIGAQSRLTVKNRGLMRVEGGLYTAESDNLTNALGVAKSGMHRIEVLSGGELNVSAFLCRGACNTVVVSNGIFTVRSSGGFQMPYFSGGDDDSELIIAGTNPVIRSETPYGATNYAIAFRRSGRIHFVIPENGYAEPPLQTSEGRLGLFNDAGDVPCTFDVSGCNPNRRISTVIAEAGGQAQLFISGSWLEKTRRALPEGARLTVKDNTLVFTYGKSGMAILCR